MSEAYTRSEMVDMLRNGVCQVKFIKVNGEERLIALGSYDAAFSA
mgnify:CR=1 FL=1